MGINREVTPPSRAEEPPPVTPSTAARPGRKQPGGWVPHEHGRAGGSAGQSGGEGHLLDSFCVGDQRDLGDQCLSAHDPPRLELNP